MLITNVSERRNVPTENYTGTFIHISKISVIFVSARYSKTPTF